jgi:hypothetical protein
MEGVKTGLGLTWIWARGRLHVFPIAGLVQQIQQSKPHSQSPLQLQEASEKTTTRRRRGQLRRRGWWTAAPPAAAARTARRGCSSTIWWGRSGRAPTASSSSRGSSRRTRRPADGVPPSPSRSSSSPRKGMGSLPPLSGRSWSVSSVYFASCFLCPLPLASYDLCNKP